MKILQWNNIGYIGKKKNVLLYCVWRTKQNFTPTWRPLTHMVGPSATTTEKQKNYDWVQRRTTVIHKSAGCKTYSPLISSSSFSGDTDSDRESLINAGAGKQKVTLFFGRRFVISRSLSGLQSARCFQRIAQLLTTLWRRRDLCRTKQTQWNLTF